MSVFWMATSICVSGRSRERHNAFQSPEEMIALLHFTPVVCDTSEDLLELRKKLDHVEANGLESEALILAIPLFELMSTFLFFPGPDRPPLFMASFRPRLVRLKAGL